MQEEFFLEVPLALVYAVIATHELRGDHASALAVREFAILAGAPDIDEEVAAIKAAKTRCRRPAAMFSMN